MPDVDQPPTTPKVLFSDTNLRLVVESGVYTLEFLAGGQVEYREVYDCKLCAIRAVLLATVQLQGPCHCSPSVLRLEDEHVIGQFAGGPN
jgi:hypothetical protein